MFLKSLTVSRFVCFSRGIFPKLSGWSTAPVQRWELPEEVPMVGPSVDSDRVVPGDAAWRVLLEGCPCHVFRAKSGWISSSIS